MIDIVVSYLDDSKEDWRDGYRKNKEKEICSGVQDESNRQAFGDERIREWGTFRYWLRGIERNCKWVRKVIIVVSDKKQIPEWLDEGNEKIEVVEHREYIDKELLPTYNALEIHFYMSEIDGVSEVYVESSDDFFFINEVEIEDYYRGGHIVSEGREVGYGEYGEYATKGSSGALYKALNNNLRYERGISGVMKKYDPSHLPEARDRDYERMIIEKDRELFKSAFKVSKFRNENNYTEQLFTDLIKLEGISIIDNSIRENCEYVTLKSDVDFNKYKDCKIVCFNDTEQLDDFEKTKSKLIEFFESVFPEKSSFEKD